MYTKILAQGTKFGSGTTGLDHPAVQCTLRKLQCKSKLTNTVCANGFTITVCTVHVLYNLCSYQ